MRPKKNTLAALLLQHASAGHRSQPTRKVRFGATPLQRTRSDGQAFQPARLEACATRNSPYFDFDRQQVIDHISAAIGIAIRWLCPAERIGSAGDQSLFPWLRRCLPVELP
jgi:hypothetical protein